MTAAESQLIAWTALTKGTNVLSSEGEEVGRVGQVIGDSQSDIFSGITLRSGLFDSERFVPADVIEEIRSDGVRLSLSADAANDLSDYEG